MNGCPTPTKPIPKIFNERQEGFALKNNCDEVASSSIHSFQKDQSININIGSLLPEKSLVTETVVPLDAKKYTIKMESDTDWPAVSATLIVGVAIAWFAYNTQRGQIKSSIATFRHKWQGELRSKIAEFIAKAILIDSKMHSDPSYLKKDVSDEIYSELILIQATIELMLDVKKEYAKTLTRAMEEIVEGLKAGTPHMGKQFGALHLTAGEVLEQAWQDIRKDLGLKKKKERWFFSKLWSSNTD